MLFGLLIRYEQWSVLGGHERDYLEWAQAHYFGGITQGYLDWSTSILRGNWHHVTDTKPPLYPIFLALCKIFGLNLQNIRLVQGTIDTLAILPLFYLLRRLNISRALALLGCLVYAVAPWWALGSIFVLAEWALPALFIVLLAAMVYSAEHSSLRPWCWLGLLGAIMALLRPEHIALIGPLALWAAVSTPPGRRSQVIAVTVFAFFLPVVLRGCLVWLIDGHFLLLSYNKYYSLYSGLGELPNPYGYFSNDDHADEILKSYGLRQNTAESEAFWRTLYFAALRDHPLYAASVITTRIRVILGQFSISTLDPGIIGVSKIAWIPFMLSAIVLMLRRSWSVLYIVGLPVTYAAMTLGMMTIEHRYVRYASLTYLLSGAVVAQFAVDCIGDFWGKRQLIGRLWVSPVVAALIWALVLQSILGQLRLLAGFYKISQVNAMTAFDDSDPIPIEPLQWATLVPDARISANKTYPLSVESGEEPDLYQVATKVALRGAEALTVNYDFTVNAGSIGFGVIDREDRWMAHSARLEVGPHRDRLTAVISGPEATLVVDNQRPERTRSVFKINQVRVSLFCTAVPDSGNFSVLRRLAALLIGPLSPPLVPCTK